MNLFLDKFIDGVFICLGVYVAFAFSQYQEEQSLKRELRFNMEQILRDMPKETPKNKVPKYRINQSIGENGYCHLNFGYENTNTTGDEYLKVIIQRGLGKFLKDKKIIPALDDYFNIAIEQTKRESAKFNDEQNLMKDAFLKNNGKCFSKKSLADWENRIRPLYLSWKASQNMEEQIGHIIFQRITKEGYAIDEKKESIKLNVNIQEEDDEKINPKNDGKNQNQTTPNKVDPKPTPPKS